LNENVSSIGINIHQLGHKVRIFSIAFHKQINPNSPWQWPKNKKKTN
jgi:hypothetical protein